MVGADWQQRLRDSGHRITPARQAVLRAVAELEHPTPESILAHLKPGDPHLNLSTVYRNLAVLQETGLITHAHIGSGAPVYHLAGTAAHIHFSCLSCGRVTSLPVRDAQDFAGLVERRTGFAIDPTHAAVFGTCTDCRAPGGGSTGVGVSCTGGRDRH